MFPGKPGRILVLLLSILTVGGSACAQVVNPIPAGCAATYNIQYVSAHRTLFRDVIPMSDGGKVTVGDFNTTDGLVTRFQSNGAILWTKNINVPGQAMQFRRILPTADGNLLIIGNNYFTQTYYVYAQMVLIKMDYNGNILWCHFWVLGYTEVADAVATPDGGFVAAFEEFWGAGNITAVWVARFDANANLVWKRDVSHGAFTPQYKAITCSPDAVFVAYDSFDGSQLDKFGVDRLDINTGNLVYSQLFTAGSTTTARINGIFAVNDSAYVFSYRYTFNIPNPNNLMAVLDQQGNLLQALNLGTDPLDPSPTVPQDWLDDEPPSLAFTPNQDFWLANRVTISGTDDLEVSRIRRDGTVESNKLHTGINGYLPFNARAQGKGLVVVGEDPAPTAGDPDFIEAFVLKLDSSGQLQTGAAANCVATDRPLTVTTCTECAPAMFNYGPPAATPGYTPTTSTGAPYDDNNDLTAVLDCFQPGNCNAVNVLQKGADCALNDTLTYYLDNSSNCGAAATWTYDPAYFKAGLISGDSIQLIVQQAGATAVTAQVEGYCQLFTQTIPVTPQSATPINLGNDTSICYGDSLLLDAGPGLTNYQWNTGAATEQLYVHSTGTYSVVADNSSGCELSAAIQIDSLYRPMPVLDSSGSICANEPKTLTPSGGPYASYLWSNGSTQPTMTITGVGSYWVQVTDTHGCVASDTARILTVTQCLVGLFVPNAFTPGFGHNTVFRPLIYGNITLLDFAIYDRYGQRVYETETPLAGWDGTIGSSNAPEGTYVWYCKYALQGGTTRLDKGTVILIR